MLPRETVARLTDLLLERRRELVRELGVLEEDLRALAAPAVRDREERGQEAARARLLDRVDEHTRRRLAEIDEALARIERGEYGTCSRCGRAIAGERLAALPEVGDCGPCAAEAEAGGGGAAPVARR